MDIRKNVDFILTLHIFGVKQVYMDLDEHLFNASDPSRDRDASI